ncbi:MAG: peptidylprolyl isomerase [Candidatus Marinimicrobia bacterium]|nr:peptidylprolyl isomerase [Candidatus Neomarinimicrobiota bacterium]
MKRFVLPILVFVLLVSSCTKMTDKDIAVVNGKKISIDELYKYITPANFSALSLEEKELQVETICYDYLARYYLEDQGDLDSGEVMWENRVWEIRELANGAYQNLVIDKILTPSALNDLYNKTKYELNISHILIGYNTASRPLNDRTREEADSLSKEISKRINNDNFSELVAEYSDDGSKNENGGNLGWSKTGRWVEEFEDAAYALEPGQISKPVETPFGFHIIKLLEKREIQVEPFEKVKDDLVEMAYSRWRSKFLARDNEVFDSLNVANPLILNDSLLNDFVDRFTRLSQNVFYSEQFTAFDIMEIFEDTLTVGYLGDMPINKAWIYQFLKMISLQIPPRFTDTASFKSFIEQNRKGALLYEAAHNLGLDSSKEFIKTRNVYLAQKASALFDKLYVFEQMAPEQSVLRDFYETYKSELYKQEARVLVREVLLADSVLAVDVLQRAKAGEDMGALATEYSRRNIGKNNKGLIPAIKRNQYGEMSIAAFNMLDGEIGGPYKIGDFYSVIQRVEYVPESFRDFDKVSYRLLTDYRNHYMNEKRAEQKAMLRNTYSMRVNSSLLK